MKCQNCGHENNDKSKFCVKCGGSIKSESVTFNKKYLILILILAAVILAAVGLMMNSSQSSEETIGVDSSTINEESYKVEIDGVTFNIPSKGYYKSDTNYFFEYNNLTCAVKEVEHYESSSEFKDIKPVSFSKDYPGSESYKVKWPTSIWTGIKINKDHHWFHISMKTENEEDALEFFDWMYEKNTWKGHK